MKSTRISIIAAMDEKRGIGKHNALMWKIPGELARFKQITMGHPIIMGRKTHESIGRVLPGRTNIVVSRRSSFTRPRLAKLNDDVNGAIICHSLEKALRIAQEKLGSDEVFIIGGGQIFTQALPLADKLYLTIVGGDFGADTFFPDYSEFKKIVSSEHKESGGYKYSFVELER